MCTPMQFFVANYLWLEWNLNWIVDSIDILCICIFPNKKEKKLYFSPFQLKSQNLIIGYSFLYFHRMLA